MTGEPAGGVSTPPFAPGTLGPVPRPDDQFLWDPDKQAMGELQFSGLEIRMLGRDSAMVLGHWHLSRKLGDVGGVFTLIFQRFPAGWRIIHDHTSAQKLTP